ncbi:hypothetical protein [Aneurinibacillus migulanus]|nr:hypothetical protein [Aneurinibacillus migulanus]
MGKKVGVAGKEANNICFLPSVSLEKFVRLVPNVAFRSRAT